MVIKPLVSLDEIKAFVNVRPTNYDMDDKLINLATVATQQIEALVRRRFSRQTITEFFTTRDTRRVRYSSDPFNEAGIVYSAQPQSIGLKGVNVDAATLDVRYDESLQYNDGTLLTQGTDYVFDEDDDGLLLLIASVYMPRALRVTYTSGYGTDEDADLSESAPAILKQACLFQTQFLNVKSRSDNVGMAGERTASGKDRVVSTAFLSNGRVTPEAVAMVQGLKRVGVGRM